ncbi:cell-cycle control medial ring component [Massariosphaeria phaeospora]|uniref:Cell-cycle control medial ring component n=1 Tax=Massariosphaeria phaeospora TaxID=100035 RepID=A0A7C8M1U0_9PLEO|nr:cell-cycle control medial ring component [Massariosphaeria phaeospora]
MKPTANTPILPLPSTNPLTTSIYDLKAAYARASSIPTTKLKILYKKKPVADTKTVAEVVGEGAGAASGEGVVEFTVMVIGGGGGGGGGGDAGAVASPPAVVPSEAEKGLGAGTGAGAAEEDAGTASTAQGPSGREVVAGAEFWDDLKGFVLQRIRDEREAERLVKVFKAAWEQER